MNNQLHWLQKYNVNGPRYTSYPTALEFNQKIADNFQRAAAMASENKTLSLYFHVPFCHQLCFYCGCNKIVSRHQEKSIKYVETMLQELKRRGEALKHKPINQIHFGGGTPNFLRPEQFVEIFTAIQQDFIIAENAEISVELDVRHVDEQLLTTLKACGVNRLSFGIQDTNPEVQIAINRVQSNELVGSVLRWVREIGFDSVNFDLIYGLPHQNKEVFEQTLKDVLMFDPDRISLFSYAHLPARFSSQRKIKDEWLPSAQTKLELMLFANDMLCGKGQGEGGYEAIGFDHFAKPTDNLVTAQNNNQLHRNFQGYTILEDSDLLAIGASSISHIGNVYMQNPKKISDYYDAYSTGEHLPELAGRILTHDDLIRANVIQSLMCNFKIQFKEIESQWGIEASRYFKSELQSLKTFEQDGMLETSKESLSIRREARLFVRNICMTFDTYLASQLNKRRYSQVV